MQVECEVDLEIGSDGTGHLNTVPASNRTATAKNRQFQVCTGHAVAEAVCRRLLTVECWVRTQASSYATTAGQSGTLLSPVLRFAVSVPFHRWSTFTRASSGRWATCPLAVAVPQAGSITPSQQHQVKTTNLLTMNVLQALRIPHVTCDLRRMPRA